MQDGRPTSRRVSSAWLLAISSQVFATDEVVQVMLQVQNVVVDEEPERLPVTDEVGVVRGLFR